ncbi:MAG: SDR family NAD(P)-dependent oxidoreductase [Salibacteraceae bacterium]
MMNVFMTGATSGFGTVVLEKLVEHGHKVLIAARDPERAKSLVDVVNDRTSKPKGHAEFIECDLASLESIREAIDSVAERFKQLDLLINNAGVWHSKFTESKDGIEETLQVNLIAPYVFMTELESLLRKSKAPKVINTASGLHQGSINFDDIQMRDRFSGFSAYRQSKLGIILTTRLLAKRNPGISYFSQHPGVVNTSLGRNLGGLVNMFFRLMGSSIEKGAKTLLYLSMTPAEQLKSGEYYAKCEVTNTTIESRDLVMAKKLEQTIKALLRN